VYAKWRCVDYSWLDQFSQYKMRSVRAFELPPQPIG
jgi:hypothetical protein